MIALLDQKIDWDYLIRVASHHGVLPLLHTRLQGISSNKIPTRVLELLRLHFQANAFRNLFLTGEMLRILKLLGDLGVSAIPFKGPALSVSIYGDLFVREFIDLDILVRKTEVFTARELLLREGYVMDALMMESEQEKRLESGCAMSLSRQDGKVTIDLHWAFAASKYSLPFDLDALRTRLEKVRIVNQEVFTLSPLDTLLLLSVHGAKHRWQRLEWICDIGHLLTTHPNLDWEECLSAASKLRVERILLHALLVVRNCVGVNLPKVVEDKLRADRVAWMLATRAVDSLFSETNGSLVTAEETAFHLQMREQLSDRMPYLFHQMRHWMIPTDRDRKIFRLPGFLSFLYYPLRPARLLFDYGLDPFSQFLKNFRFNKP